MKKIMLLLVLVLVISLSACDPAHFRYSYEELKTNIVEVQLIYYNNSSSKEINEFFSSKPEEMKRFDFEKMNIIETLPNDEIDSFLQEFSQLSFLMVWSHLDSPTGTCLRLIYQNGDFEVINGDSYGYAGSFDVNGNVKRFIGDGFIKDLCNKYFITQIK